MSLRDEIRELCIAHDKQMAEDREWLARREVPAASLVQRNDNPAGLIFKTNENALLDVPAAGTEAPIDPFEEDPLGYAVNVFAEGVEKRFDYEERQRQRLEREITNLRGQLDAVLGILGKSSGQENAHLKSANVVDLPAGFIRKRNDNAA